MCAQRGKCPGGLLLAHLIALYTGGVPRKVAAAYQRRQLKSQRKRRGLVTPTNQPSTAPCSAMLLTSEKNSKKLICAAGVGQSGQGQLELRQAQARWLAELGAPRTAGGLGTFVLTGNCEQGRNAAARCTAPAAGRRTADPLGRPPSALHSRSVARPARQPGWAGGGRSIVEGQQGPHFM